MSTVGRPYRRRRGRAVLFILLLAVLGVALYMTGGVDGTVEPVGGDSASTAGDEVVSSTDGSLDLDALLSGAERNPDGSVTVALDDTETSMLLAEAIARAPTRQLEDVSARAVAPESGAAGQLELSGRLEQVPVPVTATVDLDVAEQRVVPTLRDVRVGPVALSDDMRRDLTTQVRRLALIADDQIAVDGLTTTDGELLIRGRPR